MIFGERRHPGQKYLSEFKTPLADVPGIAFDQGMSDNPFQRLLTYGATRQDDSHVLSRDEVRDRAKHFGVHLDVDDEEGMRSNTADMLITRKYEQKVRQQALQAADPGMVTGAATILGALGAGLTDPVNVLESFIPFYGQAKWAKRTAEAAGAAKYIGRAGIGVTGGMYGTALIEGGIELSGINAQLQDDYTASDFMHMILIGGAIGGGLHLGVGAVADGIRRGRGMHGGGPQGKIPEMLDRMSPVARKDMIHTAVAQTLEARRVDVEPVMRAHALDTANTVRDTTTKLAQAIESDDWRLAEILSEKVEILRSAVPEGMRGVDLPDRSPTRVISERTLRQAHTDLEGRFNQAQARIDAADQVNRALAEGQRAKFAEIDAKGKVKETDVVGKNPDNTLRLSDGRNVDPVGDRSSIRLLDSEDISKLPPPERARARDAAAREFDQTHQRQVQEAANELRAMAKRGPMSDMIDEPLMRKHDEQLQRAKENTGDSIEEQRKLVEEAMEELEEVAGRDFENLVGTLAEDDIPALRQALADADATVRQSAEMGKALKAFAMCTFRGGV